MEEPPSGHPWERGRLLTLWTFCSSGADPRGRPGYGDARTLRSEAACKTPPPASPETSKIIHKYSGMPKKTQWHPDVSENVRTHSEMCDVSLAGTRAWGFLGTLSQCFQTPSPYNLHLAATQKKRGQGKLGTVRPFPKMETKPQSPSQMSPQLHTRQIHQTSS